MPTGFDHISHKNLELLRFYINKDIKRIENKISSNHSETFGYAVASLIDLLIVLVFDEYLKKSSTLCKIVLIFGLVILFFIISKVFRSIQRRIDRHNRAIGKSRYLSENIQQMIDDFDNIACDGLLICEANLEDYFRATKQYLKEFYLYEVLHHLQKAVDIAVEIHTERDLYVSDSDDEMINTYRIENFIRFADEINQVLQTQCSAIVTPMIPALETDLQNLNAALEHLKT